MFANVIWPSLFYFYRANAWWVVVASIAIEFLILRWSLKTTALRALGVVVVINLFSAFVGAIYWVPWNNDFPFERPMRVPVIIWVGMSWAMYVDPILGLGTFSVVSWSMTVLCGAVLSTLLEGALLFTVFRRIVASRYCLLWLTIANLASALFTYITLEVRWPDL